MGTVVNGHHFISQMVQVVAETLKGSSNPREIEEAQLSWRLTLTVDEKKNSNSTALRSGPLPDRDDSTRHRPTTRPAPIQAMASLGIPVFLFVRYSMAPINTKRTCRQSQAHFLPLFSSKAVPEEETADLWQLRGASIFILLASLCAQFRPLSSCQTSRTEIFSCHTKGLPRLRLRAVDHLHAIFPLGSDTKKKARKKMMNGD